VERVTRIELVTEAWEAFVIPFHHTRHSNLDTQAALIPQAETIGLNRPQFAGGSKVSMDGAYGKK
jgi:hypothetical protein